MGSYVSGERRPVEVLVFEVDPAVRDEFITVDHDVWTLGEAASLGEGEAPFLSKEVWVDDAHPGRVTIVFVWESLEAWMAVADQTIQARLQAEFDRRFPHPVRLVAAPPERSGSGIHRFSRYERG